MLWNQCVPPAFYSFVKQLENFEDLLSQNVSFRGVNEVVMKFVALEFQNGHDLVNYFTNYYSTYQYTYSMLFPKYYSQNNKHVLRNKIKFTLCYDKWLATKKHEQIGKNPFNFNVSDNFEVIQRHQYEQNPIKIDNDNIFRADIPDTRQPLRTTIKKVDATDGSNKENIPPPPQNITTYPPASSLIYKCAPTMTSISDFDKKYSLPKIAKKARSNEKKIAARNQKKNILIEKLQANTEKMQALKKCK